MSVVFLSNVSEYGTFINQKSLAYEVRMTSKPLDAKWRKNHVLLAVANASHNRAARERLEHMTDVDAAPVDAIVSPFYDRDGITIYNADCRDILPFLECDVVVTDPPYLTSHSGVPIGVVGDGGGGVATVYEQSTSIEMPWGYDLDWIDLIGGVKQWVVFANYKMLGGLCTRLEPQTVFVWRKSNAPQMTRPVPRLDCEFVVWSRTGGKCDRMGEFDSMVIDVPMPQAGCMASERLLERGSGKALHPCQKPLAIVRPFVSRLDSECIVDPFMGTGTTLLAAKLEGRRAIGIEIDRRYCEVAVRRLRQGVLGFGSEG